MRIINGLPEKEYYKQQYRKYRAANLEKLLEGNRERNRRHFLKNPERYRAVKRKARAARLASLSAEELAIYKKRRAEQHRRWREKHPDQRREIKRTNYRLHRDAIVKQQRKRYAMRNYGLTLEAIASMLDSQNGGCAICSITTPRGQGTWHIDHDHKTGVVRGLLCHSCNVTLGLMKDDPKLLREAAKYLESSK